MTDQIEGGVTPLVKILLWVLSQIYCLGVYLRAGLYRVGFFRSYKLASPVISVGNITLGGVGKTPLVEYIANALKEKGRGPVILIRGYMEKQVQGKAPKSDEATMLEEELKMPVLVGADRIKKATEYLKHNKADVFLLDDGFQHRRLSRDIDIVAVDTTNPWGNGLLLPRGILREPKAALKRAQVFVLTKADLGAKNAEEVKEEIKKINPEAVIVSAIHDPVLFCDIRSGAEADLSSVRDQKIVTVSSIASPNTFFTTLINLQAEIEIHFTFMDHHVYCDDDINEIVRSCEEHKIATIVTTQKDAVKLKAFTERFPEHITIQSLKIKISIIQEEDTFLERISAVL